MSRWFNIVLFSIIFVILVISVSTFHINEFEINDDLSSYNHHFVLISKSSDSLIWKDIINGAKYSSKKNDVALEILVNNTLNIENELEYFDMAVKSNVDGIIINGYEDKNIIPITNEAAKRGIPVVFINNESYKGQRLAYVGVNNYSAGEIAIKKLSMYNNAYMKIGLLMEDKETVQNGIRLQGMMNSIKNNPNLEKIDIAVAKNSKVEIYNKVKDMIKKYPDINAIVATSSLQGEVIGQVLVDLNIVGEIKVVAFDDYPETLRYIRKGVIQATIDVDGFKIGQTSVDAIIKKINGKFVDDAYYMPLKVIDKNNIDSEKEKIDAR
ncbi:sugar ABC transporter substrate-binding protein [Helicovermis profundi]|uniref:Sugar-binding protein n=1 Tax=Helicovermis profundi TaxID=3065157 RepID=A0AAU9E3F9_9FIRM|nr:sugar-binding protein [Clostridia bacterium S502]